MGVYVVISIVILIITLVTKSHDPVSRGQGSCPGHRGDPMQRAKARFSQAGRRYRSRKEAESNSLLGGSWVVISRVISRVTILITHIRGLMTLLITNYP